MKVCYKCLFLTLCLLQDYLLLYNRYFIISKFVILRLECIEFSIFWMPLRFDICGFYKINV